MRTTSYTIYSASAGSGKTSTLVKEYLKLVLGTKQSARFHQILALTFTNKAVNEMKGRIMENLALFSQMEDMENAPHMFRDICDELSLTAEQLKYRSARALKELLHNYAFFDVSTIDKFTHRLIRTFARDLKLPQNFEVVLDTEELLEEAVARLLARAGEDPDLTQILIAFSLEKIDDDRSWDIGYDLIKVGKLLFNENHLEHIGFLDGKDLESFGELRKRIQSGIEGSEGVICRNASEILASMQQNKLEVKDFNRGYFPKFLELLQQGDWPKINFDASWKQNFNEAVPYTKSCDPDAKSRIDSMLPYWRRLFEETKQAYHERSFLQNVSRNLVPLAILSAIQTELAAICKEQDLLPISAFNSLISEEIKGQPAPFIYERLGEKYRYYFIDEFQDTSGMQWENLIPLIGNALESTDTIGNHGSLMLVGDAKQAIYRWRGGKAEQFLNLINGQAKPFTIAPRVEWKPSNYRSSAQIVSFNNEFFSHLSSSLQNELYRDLYAKGSRQEPTKKRDGLVRLSFITPGELSKDELYCSSVLEHIKQCLEYHYLFSDICILTRTRAQGVKVADYLLQHDIPIISSETLLLKTNPTVLFLLALLEYCLLPTNKNAAFDLLMFLSKGDDKHQFMNSHIGDPTPMLQGVYGFDTTYVKHAPVYDSLEYAIRVFGLAGNADAYLNFLLEEALTVEEREDSSIRTFLTHWESKRDTLSIVAPESLNAVAIMTIHKAKGLEFPVVIYPYANTDIHGSRKDKEAHMWLPVEAEDFAGFEQLLLSKKKEMTSYNAIAERLYTDEQEKLELDSLNMLYVALTRAEKGLFVISERDLDTRDKPKKAKFSGLFIDYLITIGLWDKNVGTYSFGQLAQQEEEELKTNPGSLVPFLYSYKDRPQFRLLTKSGMLWDSERAEALSRGNRIHLLMAGIQSRGDLEPALQKFQVSGEFSQAEIDDLRQVAEQIMAHPELRPYFARGLTVRNEIDIISSKGIILRPDRIVSEGKKATLIDYKTGRKDPRYKTQLYEYSDALESMGFEVENKIIVYINQEVLTEFI